MKSKTWKKKISMAIATTMLLSLAPVSAMAAESKTIKNKEVALSFDGLVGETGAKTFKFTSNPKGIDLYDVDYATEWDLEDLLLRVDWAKATLNVDNVYTVEEGSTLSILQNAGKKGYCYTAVYLLDDNDQMVAVLDNVAWALDIPEYDSHILTFDNIDPMKPLDFRGHNGWFAGFPGEFPVENLLYVIRTAEDEMDVYSDNAGVYAFRTEGETEDDPVVEQQKPKIALAKGNRLNIIVNGSKHVVEAYLIDGNNYIKLRDVAALLRGREKGFDVVWDEQKKAIELVPDTLYKPVGNELAVKDKMATVNATESTAKVYKYGEEMHYAAYNIGGNTYFKLRDLGDSFDFNVGWDAATGSVTINTAYAYRDEIPKDEVTPEKVEKPVVEEEKPAVSEDDLPLWAVLADKSNVINNATYPVEGMIIYEGILFAPDVWKEVKKVITKHPEIKDELLEIIKSDVPDRNERFEELLKDKV